MNTAIGIDLNGVLDTVAHPDYKLRHAPIPPVVITDLPQGILTGEEAILSPFGRPRLAETVGRRTGILELLRALELENTDPEAPRQIGQHLYSLLPKENRSCVIAVPDIPTFNERARDRLLSGASQCGVNARLLWRPVAALLGWGEKLNPTQVRDMHGKRACVLQLLPEGIAVSELDLECVEQDAQPTLVPVRRREGLRKLYPYSNRELTDLLADEMGITDHRLLWASAWAWNALLGRTAEHELLPDTQSPSGWRMVNGVSNLQGELAKAFSETVQKFLKEDQSVLRQTSVILIEGPLAHAFIKPQLRHATQLLDLIKALITRESTAHVVAVPTTAGLVALGGAICAERQQKGQITYYDFLPMLEINVLRGREHIFAALIDKSDRVEGGKTYFNTLKDRFEIDKKSKKLVFYLLKEEKEDEKEARRREIALSVEDEVKISLHVTQVPAQGYAKIEICPDVYGALGNKPILLDWSAMDIDKRTPEQILIDLPIELGIGYPEILPQRTHHAIWEYKTRKGITIFDVINEFINCSIGSGVKYKNALQKARVMVGMRKTLFMVNTNNKNDKTIYTFFDSNGCYPTEINYKINEEINKFHEKIEHDFSIISGIRGKIRSNLARLGASFYANCPKSIANYLKSIATNKIHDPTLVLYMGRVFTSPCDLKLLFSYCDSCCKDKSLTKISTNLIRAMSDALAFRECAGKVLEPLQADTLADEIINILTNQIQEKNYKITFRATIRLIAFILRHRLQQPDFLYPKSLNNKNSQRANELLCLLKIASESSNINQEFKEKIDQVQEHILYRGTNSIIDLGDDNEDEADDE